MKTIIDTFNKDDNDCKYINHGVCALRISTPSVKNRKCIGAITCNNYRRRTIIVGL